MAKQLNQVSVNLAFTADTKQAKAQLQSLQNDLTKLSTASVIGSFNNADMEKAVLAAKDLQMHLAKAVNTDTGKLDLSRFSKSLKSANQSLESLRNDLSLAGEQGNQAFLQLARSISQAEAPTLRVNNALREMGNTLKNTIRWQLSSSMLHGFMGAVQSAYGYAKDLDKSLNNIRIVTGKSKDEMAAFAENANKAAKALNTTTTAYTDAALIYYQQGDDRETVLEKTDVTTKMANVTGSSAETVSDQLTAIWNNFNKEGQESYEKYADILTALGAATASSTDEIAGGLEKFASVADTIGLSYEYAATALATITATTRQSEDVVGNSLKTIFARIQGLNLGETLDDGTTLNKYSQALAKVGISIFEQNGELKNMDSILDEMGNKWNTLSKDQQVALAQTVAGVRQYNQLMSLMNNWDKFGENLNVAENSEGALSIQADIYAQSWEAATKRVQAATENVFDSLIDEDFFISITNGTAEVVDSIAKVVDVLGGLKGIALLIGSLFLQSFANEIPAAIQKVSENFDVFSGKARNEAIKTMEQTQEALRGYTSDKMTNALDAELTGLEKVNQMKTVLAKTSHMLTDAERQQFEMEIQIVEAASQMVAKEAEKVDAIEKEIAASQRKLAQDTVRAKAAESGESIGSTFNMGSKKDSKAIAGKLSELKALTQQYVSMEQTVKRIEQANATWLTSGNVSSKSMIKNIKVLKDSFIDTRGGVDKLTGAQKAMCDTLDKELKEAGDDVEKLKKVFEKFSAGVKEAFDNVALDEVDQKIAALEQSLRDMDGVDNEALSNLEEQFREGALSADQYKQKLLELQHTESQSVTHTVQLSETIGAIGAKMMQVNAAINAFKQVGNVFNDEDATVGEKIVAVLTALGTVIPLVTAVTNADNAVQMAAHALNMLKLVGLGKTALAMKLNTVITGALTAAKTAETGAVAANTVAWYANPIMWIALVIVGVIAVVTALIGWLAKLTEQLIKGDKIETENCDTLIENAERTKELAAANEELSDSMDDLISSYKEMNAEGENTSAILSEIAEKMPALLDSYKDLAKEFNDTEFSAGVTELENLANLGALTGDYSGFEEKKAELDREVAKKTADAAKSGATNANTKLAAKMQETQGKVSGTSYTLDVGGADSIFDKGNEETTAKDILMKNMNSGERQYAKNSTGLFKTGVEMTVSDYTNPTEFVDYYEKMVAARDEMLRTMDKGERNQSDIFREINEQIAATASEYEAAKEQADEYLAVAGKAIEASMGDTSDIDTMEEYLEYKKQFIQLAQTQYGVTAEQAEAYLKEVDSLKSLTNQYSLATVMAEKFGGIDTSSANFSQVADDYYKYMEQVFGELSEQEVQIAIAVAGTSDSMEEFAQQFQMRMVEATQAGAALSAELASQVMSASLENNKISFSQLFADDNFLEFLEQQQLSQQEILNMSYEEQYRIVSEFSNAMNQVAFDSFTTQQELYYQQAAMVQEQAANYQKAMRENGDAVTQAKKDYADLQTQLSNTTDANQIEEIKDQMEDLAEQFEQDYGFEITSNAETLQNELDNILKTIEQLQDKKIEMAMDWSGVDEMTAGMKRASEFTKLVRNDAKKVGDTYQMTAAQAQEWLEFYPELGAIAKKTDEGLIAMDAEKLEAFLDNKETELDGTIQTEINKLKVERDTLQKELDLMNADLKAAEALAQGKLQLEDTSAQYLTELRKNLTDYFLDLGMDEVLANQAALETMGLNEEEYAALVADACETNAINMATSSEDGANAQVDAIGLVVEKWRKFIDFLINNVGTVLADIGAALLDPTKTVGDVFRGYWDNSGVSVDAPDGDYKTLDDYDFDAGDPAQISAILEEVSTPTLEATTAAMEELQKAIDSIDGQITILEAMQAQGLEFLGSTDPDDVDGTNSKNEKTIEELTEIVERYHEITKEIETQNYLLNKLSKARERAYGKDKLKLMDEEIKALDILAKKNQELYDAQILFLALDKVEVTNKFANAMFDEYGNISNYSDLVQQAVDKLNAVKQQFNDSQSEEDKKALEDAQKEYEKTLAILEKYEETLSALREQEEVLIDIRNQVQDLNYEKLQEALTLKLEIDESQLKKLEFLLQRYGDNFYKMAESAAILGEQQVNNYISQLETYKGHKGSLDAAYAAGEISQADYLAGLKEVREGYYACLEALIELDQQMMHYYGDTLDAASEELGSFTDHLQHITGVFEHYVSLMGILGKQKDFKAMGDFLGGKADNIRDRLNVAKEYYQMLKENSSADEYWANYQAALAAGNDDMAQWWKEQWDAEVDALDAAQEEMLGLTEEWAEAMKAVIENKMNEIADTLEKTLTGGTTFDTLMDEFDKLNIRQEEFLTKTNQIYETNKLMRTANKVLDETDNKVAKQKLKNFVEETKNLQESTKLSQYELDIQQAKYDLLLAEIALEEAQNAKSTVRLSRDAEGNFGYVYTADQDKISDAQQKVDDADNKLYNLSLEGQQKYTEKYLQAQQAMYNELTALQQAWLNGEIASEEEYQRQKETILNHYLGEGGVLQTYSDLYRIACSTDADAVADNWQTNYGLMTQDTEKWKIAVDRYLEDIKVQTDAWKDVATKANEDVEGALEDSKTATKNLREESKKLADTITESIIPAIDKELEKVKAQTEAYAAQREELLKLIEEYMNYIDALNSQVAVQNVGFDKNVDYSGLMNEYLTKGGTVQDATYLELLKQRNAKIEWLKTQGKDASYWGTSGDETTEMYNALLNGGSYTSAISGKTMDQEWFHSDYVEDNKLPEIFESLGVPIEEIQALLEKMSESGETTNEKLDTSNEKTDTTNEKLDTSNEKADTTNEELKTSNEELGTANENLGTANEELGTANEELGTANTGLENIKKAVEDVKGAVEGVEQAVSDGLTAQTGAITMAIGTAAGTISGAVAGATTGLVGSIVGAIGGTLIGKIAGMDTGGYTGDWGPEGKLAVLHEKELVLNANDTENLLSTIDFVRSVVGMIDARAANASLSSMNASVGVPASNETLEQNVTIHAEFPNATNHSEIEEAFNNLVNRASQYANKK